MSSIRSRASFALLVLAAGLTACVSLKRTQEARFFHLRAVAEPETAGAAEPGTLVGVLPVRLPGHLARPQLVTEVAPGELRVDEFRRWAEPLEAGVTRVLAENLANLLPEHRVVRFPWRDEAPLRCRVTLELSDFSLHGRSEARLAGRFTLLPPGREGAFASRAFSLRRDVADGPAAAVESLSALLADLSRQIAQAVRALPSEATVAP